MSDTIQMETDQIKVAEPMTPKNAFSHKFIGQALALLVVLAACLYFLHERARVPTVAKPAPIISKTIQVQRGNIEQTVLATGKLQLFRYADLGAQVSGEINDVRVAVGDEVSAGDLLLKIAPTLSVTRLEANQAQLAALRAGLTEQQAQLEFAELQFKRQSQLKAENATREESFEASRAGLSSAAARLEAIKAHIRETESATKDDEEANKHTAVTAPFSGTVVELSARAGQAVSAHQQTQSLVRIADLSRLTVQARVAEIDVPRVHKGMSAYFTTPGFPGKRWYGKVRQVIPVPADRSGEQDKDTFYNVLFEVSNPDRELLGGMSTQVSFVTAHAQDATMLPVGILNNPDRDGLYSVKIVGVNRQPEPRRVRLGIRTRDQVQVLSGLVPGEQLVVEAPTSSTSTAPGNRMAGKSALLRLTE